jgi:hypothetical protein
VAVRLWPILNVCLALYNSIGNLPYATLAITDGFVFGPQICGNGGMFCKFLLLSCIMDMVLVTRVLF